MTENQTPEVVEEETTVVKKKAPATKKAVKSEVVEGEIDDEDEQEEKGTPIGQSEKDFFNRKDLLEKKARIYVEVAEARGEDEKGKSIVMYPAKEIEVQPAYWNTILRDKETGLPMKEQKLVGYKIEEGGKMKQYKFKE